MQASYTHPRAMFLYALLVHIIFLFLLFNLSTENHTFLIPAQQLPLEIEQPDYTISIIAALTPGASSLGNSINLATQENNDADEKEQEQPTQMSLKEDENSTVEKVNESEEKNTELLKINSEPETKINSSNNTATAIKKITPPQKIAQKNNTHSTQRQARRQLTLNDLAQGFLQTINQGGQDFLKRDGDPNKRPDGAELKYLTYVQRIIWYMQNEWRINQENITLNGDENLLLTIAIDIMRDGALQGIRIINASGNNSYDSFLIKGIETAAPYPAVPSFLKEEPFQLVLSIVHEGMQPWRVNLRSNSLLKMR